MISSLDKAFLIVGSLGFICAIAYLIAGQLNTKRFKEICILYKEKFGNLPDAVVLFEDVNTFFVEDAYSIKMQFIFIPLLWNRSSILTKNDDKDFIRGLPKRLIRPFYIEFYIGAAALFLFIIGGILMLAIKHHWL